VRVRPSAHSDQSIRLYQIHNRCFHVALILPPYDRSVFSSTEISTAGDLALPFSTSGICSGYMTGRFCLLVHVKSRVCPCDCRATTFQTHFLTLTQFPVINSAQYRPFQVQQP
jgi:hypothetical protein